MTERRRAWIVPRMTATRRKTGLQIVDNDDGDKRKRDRQDGMALVAAQRLVDEGRVDEAREVLSALAASPSTAIRGNASLLYAGLLLMGGHSAEALEVLGRLPDRPGFPIDEGYRRMIEACALRQARRYDDALVAARASVACGPTSGRLLVLADAQKHAGRLDDACATLARLLEQEPANATALAQLAGYRNLQGDFVEGERLYRAFLAVADEGADGARNAAFVHATKNDIEATLTFLQRALALEPGATRSYISDEIELDRFRAEPRFVRLVEPRAARR